MGNKARIPIVDYVARLNEFERELFSRRTGWAIQDAAEQFEVDRKTIRNWVKRLGKIYPSEKGGPAVVVRNSVISVKAASLAVTPRAIDYAALALAKRLMGFAAGSAVADGIDQLRNALAESVDERGDSVDTRDLTRLNNLDKKFAVFSVGVPKYESAVLNPIFAALTQGHRLELRYKKWSGPRIVEPLCLVSFRDVLYLIVRTAHSDRPPHHLSVDRITEAKELSESFSYPADFTPEGYRGNKFGLMGFGEPMKVVLRFAADQTLREYISKRTFHPGAQVTPLPRGYTQVTFETPYTPELVAWICAFGDEVVVEGPRGLRREVAERLKSAARQYQTSWRGFE